MRGNRYGVQVRRQGLVSRNRSFLKKADRQDLSPSRESLDLVKLGDLVRRYRNTLVPSLKASDRELYVVNAFVRHPICRKPLSELSVADFAKYRDERLKSVKAKSLK